MWIFGATNLPLSGGPDPVLPEEVTSPVQLKTGHTLTVPGVQIPAGGFLKTMSSYCVPFITGHNIYEF